MLTTTPRKRVSAVTVIVALLIVALVLVALDNTDDVRVGYVFGDARGPVWIVLLAAAVGFAQDKKADKKDDKKDDKKAVNLYPLAKGTKWEYTVKFGDQELEATQEVNEVSEPKKKEEDGEAVAVEAKKEVEEEDSDEEVDFEDV